MGPGDDGAAAGVERVGREAFRVIEGGRADDAPAQRQRREMEFRYHGRRPTPVGTRRFCGESHISIDPDDGSFAFTLKRDGRRPAMLIGDANTSALDMWTWALDYLSK